ncbi:hypothetical protein J6590_026095 [Homalodisca vitripennis]|nr:hypothetical protein J6590_026095 [Homalodisca vitripennis]
MEDGLQGVEGGGFNQIKQKLNREVRHSSPAADKADVCGRHRAREPNYFSRALSTAGKFSSTISRKCVVCLRWLSAPSLKVRQGHPIAV